MNSYQRLLAHKYIAYQFLTHLWFVGAVWLYFYRIFITDYQVGILDAFAFAIGLIAEVPSGALADKFGKSRIVKLGQLLAGTGLLIQAFGSGFVPFFVGQAITMIGISFASGADQALFFEKLKFEKNSVDWRRLVTRGTQFTLAGSLIAMIVGSFLHEISPRLPWIFTGLSFIGSVLVIWTLRDERAQNARQKFMVEIQEYLRDIKEGFKQFRLPALWLYVPIILTVQGLFYTAGWGILRLVLLDRFSFSPFGGAVALAVSSLITVGILAYMHKHAEKVSEKQIITLISLSAGASMLLSLADLGVWGFVVIFILYAGEHVLYPFMSEVLNNRAPDKQRATVLSVGSFLRTLPYVVLAPIIGYLSTTNNLEYFFIFWTVCIGLALAMYLSLKKTDMRIDLTKE